MSFNGSGVYSLPGIPLANGGTVDATEHNTFRNDVAGAFNLALTRDGQSSPTANIPMAGYKLMGLAAGSGVGDSVRFEQLPSASNLLPVGSGGTGASSFTSGALLKGNGTSAVSAASSSDIVAAINTTAVNKSTNLAGGGAGQIPYQTGSGATLFVPAGTAGQVLLSGGTSAPSWSSVTDQSTVTGAFKNLALSANGTSANVSVSADELVLSNSSNQYTTVRSVSLTINSATSGANGLDTGSIATSTWYSVWVIWNGTTTAGLLSTSATAPTLPSGYTYKARVGWIRTDGTANKYPLGFKQYGNDAQYVITSGGNVTQYPQMASGVAGTFAPGSYVWSAVAVSNYIPSTASSIKIQVGALAGSGYALACPNNVPAGGYNSLIQPPFTNNGSAGGNQCINGAMLLESTNVYYIGTSANSWMQCFGWKDNL